MSQRIILLTGANGGLGQAIARGFLKQSVDNIIWLTVHSRRDHAQTLCGEFAGRCQMIDLDVTKPAAWKSGVACILAEHQRLDVLVNNAGKHQNSLLATMPEQVWREVLSTNLDAIFHGCQAVLPTMISQRSGRIVTVASLSAWLAPAGQANYAAAKAGVLALTQSLAKEVARIGITVNAVCPGYIDTDALDSMAQEEKQKRQAMIPMRRFGKPEEVAAAVQFLACPEASYITGSVLKVDGGIF